MLLHRGLVALAVGILVGAGFIPANAQTQQPPPPPASQLTFTCTRDSGAQTLGSGSVIVCTLASGNAPVAGVPIDGEILAGSVSDRDGTTPPPDFSAITDANGRAEFIYDARTTGHDDLCFWYDENNNDDINEGSQGCVDDQNTEPVSRDWAGQAPKAPVLKVGQTGVSEASAKAFVGALGLGRKVVRGGRYYRKDGSILYIDKARFQRVPTTPFDGEVAPDEDDHTVTPRALNIEALEKLAPIPEQTAQGRVDDALQKSGLSPGKVMPKSKSQWETGHGELEILANDSVNRELAQSQAPAFRTGTFDIDTTVSFEVSMNGTPVVGPGQNFRVSFDPSGKVSFIRLETRELVVGRSVRIMTPEAAADQCAETYVDRTAQPAGGTDFNVSLVYYAPELRFKKASTIYPHYNCTSTIQHQTGATIETRPFEIPAIPLVDLPRVEASATNAGPVVNATATVTGGTAPYRYRWSSVLTTGIPEGVATDGPTVSYEVRVREESTIAFEIAKVEVTDANGIRTRAFAYTPVSAIVGGTPSTTRRVAYGSHYVGETYSERSRLRWPALNTAGFQTVLETSGVARNYALGERWVYEVDFVDPDMRASGRDETYADNVDIFWFTGHANGDLYLLSRFANRDDDSVAFFDVSWGDRDLEWANIAACGPLQATTGNGTLNARWGRAFQGLHILNGYATVSNDGDREGRTFASHLVGAGTSEKVVRTAWSLMAIDAQGPAVIHGSMGPIGSDWLMNINDHFWGHGSVGPDIRAADTIGYWVMRYPS